MNRTRELYQSTHRFTGTSRVQDCSVVRRDGNLTVVEYRARGRKPDDAVITTPHPKKSGWRLAWILLVLVFGCVGLTFPFQLWGLIAR